MNTTTTPQEAVCCEPENKPCNWDEGRVEVCNGGGGQRQNRRRQPS
ncbi:MAG: hypothetical protein QOH35_4640 [Acidobacteriaceae bacterium]|jgi:hypothetical protein|nr:hypothetical protein [Acidobacteriaceae bacterium]